jgi:hypothetical protein
MEPKIILCDSGSFISLTTACLDPILYFLSEKFKVKFVIPTVVRQETVDYPLQKGLKQYAFSAIKIKEALKDGVISAVDMDVTSQTQRILRMANGIFYAQGRPLQLIQHGEAEMLALARALDIKDILIDERTTRMLIESPFSMKDHLAEEFGVNIMLDRKALLEFGSLTKGMTSLRSSELVMVAYENGYFDHFDELKHEALSAALYKIRFSGCSIRFDEIEEYVKMAR